MKHLIMAIYYNISMAVIVWLLSYFALPIFLFPCLSQRQRNEAAANANNGKESMERITHVFQVFSS